MNTLVFDARPDVWLPIPEDEVPPEWAASAARRMIEARGESQDSSRFAVEFERLLEERDPEGEFHRVAFVAEDPDASFIVRFVVFEVDGAGGSDALRHWATLAGNGWSMDTVPTADGRVMRRGLQIGARDGSPVVEMSFALTTRMPEGAPWDVVATATTPMMSLLAAAAPYIEELVASIRVHE